MKIYTQNSIYEFNESDHLVRRLPRGSVFASPAPLDKDNEWVKYVTAHYELGEPMRLVTEHLGGDKNAITLRTTSTVLEIEA